jgi:membrane-bound lytic murein transglycosylase D
MCLVREVHHRERRGGGDNEAAFGSLSVKMGKDEKKIEEPKAVFVAAHIKGKYKDFKDGDLVTIEIDDNLVVQGGYTKKGSDMKAQGWIIDNKIYFDLGYGHDVLLYDSNGQKGLDMKSLRKGEPVLLKNLIYDDHKW